ncbi:Rap/ran-GAP family protein [Trichomonas vaginalis G3]|uniref:Rap/ran-GAP family protein n=1 Tax=Trichomonas vaginalis (strain ATCC PRA-98 / G3) TaxID=412133 RepID=A2EWK9_TRIV3|nr:GTPase activator protein [Trichomonas vaginalis G3]EAY02963.1 Rap/ran-GAP family protein [Trichomonas vaginalis G3]KAI5492196.1 GTPase activator protein [Trichomonas vaginalis G3]|eukprot:XP_001315186.1 Rap/ran-GAP family protein [Trichomonas vaginalis G3]
MPHPAESNFKYILNQKDFNLEKFIGKYFPEFWRSILDYVKSNNKRSEKGIFGKTYNIDFQRIAQSLTIILPKIKVGSYSPDKVADADTFFGMIFHPDSPEDLRQLFAPIYLTFLETCNDAELPTLKSSFKYFIPIPFLGKNEQEKAVLKTFIDREPEAILGDETAVKQVTNVQAYIEMLLKWILKNWDHRSGSLMQPLFQNTLSAIYFKEAEATGWDLPVYRCSTPVTSDIHETICKFFGDLFNEDHNFNILLEKKTLNFIIEILKSSETACSIEATKSSLQALIAIASNGSLSEGYELNDLISKAGQIAIDLFVNSRDGQIALSLSEFAFWLFLDKETGSIDSRKKLINDMLSYALCDDQAAAIMMGSLIVRLLLTGDTENFIWDTVTDHILNNEIYAATAAKHMQLIATIQFSSVFNINKDTIFENCSQAIERNQRNKITTPFDFVAQNIEAIIKNPPEIVHDKVKMSWPKFSHFNDTLKLVPFTVADLTYETDEMYNGLAAMIDSLSRYPTFDSPKAHENGFAVLNSYYAMFATLRLMPPGIQYSHTRAFEIASRPLFSGLITEENIPIQTNALKTLGDLLLTQDLKNHVTDEMLSHWYSCLLLTLMSSDHDLSKLAFESAVSTMMIGFKGSGILAPTLLKFVSNVNIESQSVLSLISSSAIMRCPHSMDKTFYDSIKSKLDNRSHILRPDWKSLLTQESDNLIPDLLKAVDKLGENDSESNIEILSTACSTIIIDEIHCKNPDKDVISFLLKHLTNAVKKQSEPALQMCLAVAQHSNQIIKICKKPYYQHIKELSKMADQITVNSEPHFTFAYMHIMTTILVTSLDAGRQHAHYFNDLLTRFINETVFPNEYPSQIQQFAISAREMLSIFLASYPFTDCPSIPSGRCPKSSAQPLTIIMPNGTYITPELIDEKTTSYLVQTRVGQFIWNMTSYTDCFTNEECKLTLCEEKGEPTIQSINIDVPQQEFTKIFTDIVEGFKEEFHMDYKLDDIKEDKENLSQAIDDINKYYEEYVTANTHQPARKIRPPLEIESKPFAGLNAIGMVEPKQAHELQRTTFNKQDEQMNVSKNNIETLFVNILKADHRWQWKAAIGYVRDGITDQLKILMTKFDQVSPRFKEFISLLGWNVSLKNWPIYSGGLDVMKENNGVSSIFIPGFDYELMFHVAPLMPTNKKDEQQVDKKKHLGNDHIQILFVESDLQYDPLTITSQFNFVTIIVYPLQTGLYRIDMHHRDGLKWFGPLHDPVVVSKECLSSLINSTINIAMNNFRIAQCNYSHPTLDSLKKIQQITTDYVRTEQDDESTIQELQLYVKPPSPES